jgi:Bacterial SH3 domain
MALCGGCWLSVALIGCSGPQPQQTESNGTWNGSYQPSDIGEKQLDAILAMVSQLQIATQDSLDAAKMVGTPDHELTEARQYFASAEEFLQGGKVSYTARQYRESWEQLRAADTAFRRAEESAVRAGLGQLERELSTDYGRLLPPENRSRYGATGAVRVSQGNVNLRDGAGMGFQVIGQAQLGDTLNLLAESGEWYCVRTAAGLVGWVSKALVTRLPEP